MTESTTGPAAPFPSPVGDSSQPPPGPRPTNDVITMAVFAHLLGMINGFFGPLMIWMVKKGRYPFLDDQAKESLNFQITVAIAIIGIIVLSILLSVFIIPLCVFLGFFLGMALEIVNVIFCCIACKKVNKGIAYRYPFALRLVK